MKRVVVYVIVLVVLAVAFLEKMHHDQVGWTDAPGWILKPMSLAAGVLLGLELVFDKWAWRWLPLAVRGRPYLQGTWKTQFHTTLKNPETGERWEPADAYLVVKQTFSKIHVRLFTSRSGSLSLVADLEVQPDGFQRMVVIYQNTPGRSERDGVNQIHFGGMILRVCGTPPSRLEGHYWTDRTPQSKGDLTCTERKNEIFDTFDAAAKAFCSPADPEGQVVPTVALEQPT